MALFIRDAGVDALAEEVRRLTHAKTKTEVVRLALQAQLSEIRRALPLKERLKRAKALADQMGTGDTDFDMKTFSDEMWGEASCLSMLPSLSPFCPAKLVMKN